MSDGLKAVLLKINELVSSVTLVLSDSVVYSPGIDEAAVLNELQRIQKYTENLEKEISAL